MDRETYGKGRVGYRRITQHRAAIVKRLAANGAAVALTYSTSPERAAEVVRAIETAGGKALAVRADAGDVAVVKAAVAKTVQTFGRLEDLLFVMLGLALWRISEQPAASVPISVYGLERRSEAT